MERISVLPIVGGSLVRDRHAPEDTLDVGQRGRVRAALRIGVKRGVTLEVEVESHTPSPLIAERSTLESVVLVQGRVSHVGRSRG